MIEVCIIRCIDFAKWLNNNIEMLPGGYLCNDFCAGISMHMRGEHRECVKNSSKLIVIWHSPSFDLVPDDISRKPIKVSWPTRQDIYMSCYGFKCDATRQNELQNILREWCAKHDDIVRPVNISSILDLDIASLEWTEEIWG